MLGAKWTEGPQRAGRRADRRGTEEPRALGKEGLWVPEELHSCVEHEHIQTAAQPPHAAERLAWRRNGHLSHTERGSEGQM